MKDIKESNPVELSKYVLANDIDTDPAFAWWVLFTVIKRNRIASKLQNKYWRTTHKFGIEVPTPVKRAYDIDDETGTEFCRK